MIQVPKAVLQAPAPEVEEAERLVVYVPPQLKEKLRKVAESRDMTSSDLANEFILAGLRSF